MFNSSWNDRGYQDRGGSLRRDFAARLKAGHGRRRASGPVPWLVVGAVVFLVAVIGLGPAISAAEGHGTRGNFVAQTYDCHRSCHWKGKFELPDGQITRLSVEYSGDETGMHAGTKVRALDTGDLTTVFAGHGSTTWVANVVELALAIPVIVLSAWRLVKRRRSPEVLSGD
jgi:hypothetical protein